MTPAFYYFFYYCLELLHQYTKFHLQSMLGFFTKESPPLISRASAELLKVYQSEELAGMPVENSKTLEDTRGILLEVLNAKKHID